MSESATKGHERRTLESSTQKSDNLNRNVPAETCGKVKERHRAAARAQHSEDATAEVIFNTAPPPPPPPRRLG